MPFNDAQASNEPLQGFLIDGFPMDVNQAKAFQEDIGEPKAIIYFEANESVSQNVMKKRKEKKRIKDKVRKERERDREERKKERGGREREKRDCKRKTHLHFAKVLYEYYPILF